MILDGAEVAGFIKQRHLEQVRKLSLRPRLVDVWVGNDPATARYVRAKQAYGRDIGVEVESLELTGETAVIVSELERLGRDDAVTGIIVQLPLPPGVDQVAVIAAIAPSKDVDGLRPDSPFASPTAAGVMWLLGAYAVPIRDRMVVVVGQGHAGAAIANLLEAAGARVKRADINTVAIAELTREGDIVVAAAGQPQLIKAAMLKTGAVVIDVGTTLVEGKLVGDVDPAVLADERFKVTPSPGGVGPMTVAVLFEHLLAAAGKA